MMKWQAVRYKTDEMHADGTVQRKHKLKQFFYVLCSRIIELWQSVFEQKNSIFSGFPLADILKGEQQ